MGFMFRTGDRVRFIGITGTVTATEGRVVDGTGRSDEVLYRVRSDNGKEMLLPGKQLEDLESTDGERFIVELTIFSEKAIDADTVLAAVSEAATQDLRRKQMNITGGAIRRMYEPVSAGQWGVHDDSDNTNEPF